MKEIELPGGIVLLVKEPSRRVIPKLTNDQLSTRAMARKETKRLIKRGYLSNPCYCESPTCDWQSDPDGYGIHPHHIYYREPAWIIWLCRRCHKRLHREHKAEQLFWNGML